MSTSKKMSTILEDYDIEINGEQEKRCCARLLLRRKQKESTVNIMQSFRFSIVEAPLFEDKEKLSYTSMFYKMKQK